LATPPDARVWDLAGATVYAGFIDPSLSSKPAPATGGGQDSPRAGGRGFLGVPGNEKDPGSQGPGAPLSSLTPQRRVVAEWTPDAAQLEGWREAGLTAAVIAPDRGLIRGTSALVLLGSADPNGAILRPDVFLHVSLRGEDDGEGYPGSLMGRIAATRQAFLDAEWAARDGAHFAAHPDRPRPAFDPSAEALGPALRREQTVVFEFQHALGIDQASRIAREFGLQVVFVGSGQEWRRPDLVAAAGAPVILPLRFPSLPALADPADLDQLTLDQLRGWDWAPEVPALLRRSGIEVALTSAGLDAAAFRKAVRQAIDRGLSEADALAALTTVPARLAGADRELGTIAPGKLANLTVVDGSWFDPEAKVRGVWIEGIWHPVKPGAEGRKEPATEEERAKQKKDREEAEKKRAELAAVFAKREARAPLAERGPADFPGAVLVRGATVWTCGPRGRFVGDLLVEKGVIAAVGTGLAAPAGALIIDGTGLHVTPGLIDCHSHSMIVGGVNEGTLPSTAMVRIGDVVNSETDRIYEQLAGGLTTASLLHGSANPIGGQNCVIKLRDGASPAGLVFAEAPRGIKFALGENVKQSNWGEKHTTRFPQSRMGVAAFFENRFLAARRYLDAWEAARKDPEAEPVRRDLELEALGEILQGSRLIHCHSYRADEILMLVRLMDGLKVRIGTFQHVLEGYKVADEIARHGAGGSAFSDWWAYKFEVYDAIPHAGALMHERGVVVSFNSDSSDFARRLNLEAAKAVKYGGVPEEEALKFVTLNPARQLGVDRWVGSLEPGKHADFAVWSASPLDSSSMCVQTWIDGARYFDRAHAGGRAGARQKEREALIAKLKKTAEPGGGGAGAKGEGAKHFGTALEKANDGITDVHCGGACLHGCDNHRGGSR
ncbi:MAG: amidohydrolase family protein, partial [Candidatus Brocadiae bacterium]|nr:amidohydrolase family protein [Candidatus Brocadiia bacterium]